MKVQVLGHDAKEFRERVRWHGFELVDTHPDDIDGMRRYIATFAPNRLYPFETHGAYFGKRYVFGNIPLVNWLPDPLRDRFAPHVRAYTMHGIERLFAGGAGWSGRRWRLIGASAGSAAASRARVTARQEPRDTIDTTGKTKT